MITKVFSYFLHHYSNVDVTFNYIFDLKMFIYTFDCFIPGYLL